MTELLELQYDVLASIDCEPCTLEELAERDFLKRKSSYASEWSVSQLIQHGYVKEVGNKLYSVKRKAKKVLKENSPNFFASSSISFKVFSLGSVTERWKL